jgi:hypothetical protein
MPYNSNDYPPPMKLNPRPRHILFLALAIGLALLFLALALGVADAAPNSGDESARICRAYAWTCTQYRSVLGVRYCTAWQFRCTGYYAQGKIAGLAAPVRGNGGGCAEGNKWRGLSCVITAYRPGFVSGTCDGGLWFADERTARYWTLNQAATAQGCEYEDWRISGAPGWKFRLSR